MRQRRSRGCHPALSQDLDSMYLVERLTEVRTLCDPLVRDAVREAGINPLSFSEIT
jgi:predicted glycoside hydrolase/deacetylase ChbG (UPF0249 family)